MTSKTPRAPAGLAAAGRKMWREVLARFELDHETLALLVEACRVVDRLDLLDEQVRRDGVMSPADTGKVHPALTEARQQEVVLARLVASLRLPDDDDSVRPQRRGGARGTYMPRSVQARAAANARWGTG